MQLTKIKSYLIFPLLVFLLLIFQRVGGFDAPWVLFSCALGFILARFSFKNICLIPLSIGHFFFTISFGSWPTLTHNFIYYGSYFIALLIVLYLILNLTKRTHRTFRILIYLITVCLIIASEKLGWVTWFNHNAEEGLRLLLWPMALLFALDQTEIQKIKFSQLGHSLFPAWNMQLFHNVPTENQEDWRSVSVSTEPGLRKLQRQGLYLIVICIALAVLKLLINELISISGFSYLTPLRLMKWRNYGGSEFSLTEKIVMVYFNFSYMLLHFTILGTFANACAKIWGYDFHLNVNFFKGAKILTQWNLLFYYLNQLVLKIFFNPLCEALTFIEHRKIRISVAMIISIYGFGFLYLVFLLSDFVFTHEHRDQFIFQRAIYLGVLCLFGLFRIWGPRKNKSKLLTQLSPFLYFLVFAPILMFGMLTMDLNFNPF